MPSLNKILLLLLVLGVFQASAHPRASATTFSAIDALSWNGETIFPLTGYAYFYKGQLLTPAACQKTAGEIISFPELWKAEQNGVIDVGVATYSLLILLPRDHPTDLALTLPQIYSAYKLWANGKPIAENGVVAISADACIPQWLPQTVAFTNNSDTLNLVLQIANFHHAKGGIKEPIYLGTAPKIQFKRTIAVFSNIIESAVLVVISIFFFFIYFTQTKKRVTLYFAMLALTWALRSVFSNLYLAVSFYPQFDWATMVRIEYIALYLTMIWAILFLSQIFQFEANIFFKYALVFCNLLFTAFTLFSSPRSFTTWLNFYLIASGVLLLYGGFTVIRAWVNERVGSGLLTISTILGLNIFAYDIFVYEGFSAYDPLIFSVGYISIFVLMGWALAMYLGLIKSKPSPMTRLTYDDLYRKD